MLDFMKMALQYIPQYFTDLLELMTGPKEFLARQDAENPEVVQRAWVFYGISTLIATIAMMPALPRGRPSAELFVIALATSAITLLLSLLIVKLSWRLVGGKANLKATFTVYSYVGGPAVLLVVVFVQCGNGILLLGDPALAAFVRDRPTDAYAAALSGQMPHSAPYAIAGWMGALGFLATAVWYAISWGAFRRINQVSRTRSFVAGVICYVLTIPYLLIAFTLSLVSFT